MQERPFLRFSHKVLCSVVEEASCAEGKMKCILRYGDCRNVGLAEVLNSGSLHFDLVRIPEAPQGYLSPSAGRVVGWRIC